MNNDFTFIDLFSGIGGFKMALSKYGGKCLNFSEINKDAIHTYCENYKVHIKNNLGDITKINELPDHDILTAGVPCQSWSSAGKKLGFNDSRGQLWNNTIYLLKQSQPKAFVFENVKGLADPRNKESLDYIHKKISEAGYYSKHFLINSYNYGVPQNRERIYIIGFKEEKYFKYFEFLKPNNNKLNLANILGISSNEKNIDEQRDLFSDIISKRQMSLSSKNGVNDYFLFNDLRNGKTTIHSWDIIDTTQRQKEICLLLLKNRRKKLFGKLDGNPISLKQFKSLDNTINKQELEELIRLDIFKKEEFRFEILISGLSNLTPEELEVIESQINGFVFVDELKTFKKFKNRNVQLKNILNILKEKKVLKCVEKRYNFKNTKISTGLFGISRVFLPSSNLFPTLVASDTNDYISEKSLNFKNDEDYKTEFLNKIYIPKNFRKITKEEACKIQGFPKNFILPQKRTRWMKLLGNSVTVPVIEIIIKSIINTGVFDKKEAITKRIKTTEQSVFT
jgi:DNA (cytosine-5)-methyltransferase 1